MTNPAAPAHHVLQQAAAWYALLRSGRATEQDHGKWRHWHDQHAEHRQAWNMVERISGRFGQFGEAAEKQGAMAALQASGGSIGRRQALLSLGGLGLASWLGWRALADSSARDYLGGLLADYATHTGQQRQIELADGGQLWLNTLSAVDIGADRQIRLISGEVYLDDRLSHGALLRINTPVAALTSRQGSFNLRLNESGLCIDVYTGVVDVVCNGQQQRVVQGKQLTVTLQGMSAPLPAVDAHRAWINGVLVADGTELGQVIAELGRYRHGYLGCDPAIARLSVVGTFSIRDTDRALAALASALPIRVNRLMPWWVTLQARA